MKNLIQRSIACLNRLSQSPQNDQGLDAVLPIGMAAVASFISLAFIYYVSKRWLPLPVIPWMKWLAYGFSLAIIYGILYHSGWHRDRPVAARCGSLLLRSLAVFGGVLLAMWFMIILAAFLAIAWSARTGGR